MRRLLWVRLILFALAQSVAAETEITHYRAVHPAYCTRIDHEEWTVLREFHEENRTRFLSVDTRTLRTGILDAPVRRSSCRDGSRYRRLLRSASSPPFPLQNDGITHGDHGLYLTTDLCPSSKKGFERRLYETIVQHFPHPVPLTLFITERWIDAHPDAFETLRSWDRNGSLEITWGNHTAWHHYHPGKPLEKNFVLSPEENLTADVLELERTLLQRGITPSIFFRFPGLVSDERSVQTVQGLGLITIGTDAWLAKGQTPKEGSILLLHGNRNEPKGIDRFLRLLERGKIRCLHPLPDLDTQISDGQNDKMPRHERRFR